LISRKKFSVSSTCRQFISFSQDVTFGTYHEPRIRPIVTFVNMLVCRVRDFNPLTTKPQDEEEFFSCSELPTIKT